MTESSEQVRRWREAADRIWEIGKEYEEVDRVLCQRIQDLATHLHARAHAASIAPPKEG